MDVGLEILGRQSGGSVESGGYPVSQVPGFGIYQVYLTVKKGCVL